MGHKVSQESNLDTAAARALDGLGQRISRRGIVARVGRFILSAMGLSVVAHLPIDRTFKVEAQGTTCCLWQLCGIWGWLCNGCCGGGGGLTGCPSCSDMVRGNNYWTKCCKDTTTCPPSGKKIRYWDCCTPSATDASTCKGVKCEHNSAGNTAWCPSPLVYACTHIEVMGSCSSPVNNPC